VLNLLLMPALYRAFGRRRPATQPSRNA